MVGHSQGGTVAQILGHLYGDSLAFIASLAAPTYDTQRRLTYEYYNDFLCSGEPDDIARDKAEKKALSDLNWVNAFPLTKTWRHLSELSDFDPASHLAQLQLPSYFAFAELDYYVSSEWGIDALEQAGLATVEDAQHAAENSTKATIELFLGLDHDFRPTPDVCTGAEFEFGSRREKKESDHSSVDPATSLETPKSDAMKSEKPAYSKEFQQSFQQWVLAQFRLGVL